MKTGKRKRVFLALAVLLLLLFIWVQSALPEKDSADESGWFRENVVDPVLRLVGVGPASDHTVRKAAHIVEYFLLSLFMTLFLNGKAGRAFFVCFGAAFLDETIQLFSRRGSQVRDVWIDLIGVAAGVLLGVLLARRRPSEG